MPPLSLIDKRAVRNDVSLMNARFDLSNQPANGMKGKLKPSVFLYFKLHLFTTGEITQKMSITPLSHLRVIRRQIQAWERIPNTSIQAKPLLIYHSAFNGDALEISSHLEKVGAVDPQWTYSMYPTSHFHSNTHEVLSVVAGEARLCFGHEGNPDRYEPVVSKGDIIIIPAGVSHRLLEDLDEQFTMVGSYPPGKVWDMCYGKKGEEDKINKIGSLEWFSKDPLYGEHGPALEV